MSTQTTLVATLRTDLHDEDALAYRWTDLELQRHLQRAVAEYGNLAPQDYSVDIAGVDGQYVYSLATPAGALFTVIERVEYPQGENPPAFVAWELRGTDITLRVDTAPVAGYTVRVHGGQAHVVDGAGSTIPAVDERVVLLGAQAYALAAWSLYAVNRVANSPKAQEQAEKAAYSLRRQFETDLARLRKERTQLLPSRVALTGYEI
ncbi:MAG: hypothetical protein M1401_17400 [Chloroflexi bacterium]|nr:hypothetical protein [Chloroflexota bacterium]